MKTRSISITIFLLFISIASYVHADQVIYVDIADFDPALSQFGVDVKGNKWVESKDDGALDGSAFGGPGDNDHGNGGGEPYLTVKLPVPVKAGESTADGKKWAAWARLYVPISITSATDFNSLFLRLSPDAKKWTPENRGNTALRFNDPGAIFPDSVNDKDVLLTDVGKRLPWYWLKHSANGQSTVDPPLAVGVNYIEVGIRESDAKDFPRIDVICLRNDDGKPSDKEAAAFKGPITNINLRGKLTSSWGKIKSTY